MRKGKKSEPSKSLFSKFSLKKKQNIEISGPYEVKHNKHVAFDPTTGFTGVPKEWSKELFDKWGEGFSSELVSFEDQESDNSTSTADETKNPERKRSYRRVTMRPTLQIAHISETTSPRDSSSSSKALLIKEEKLNEKKQSSSNLKSRGEDIDDQIDLKNNDDGSLEKRENRKVNKEEKQTKNNIWDVTVDEESSSSLSKLFLDKNKLQFQTQYNSTYDYNISIEGNFISRTNYLDNATEESESSYVRRNQLKQKSPIKKNFAESDHVNDLLRSSSSEVGSKNNVFFNGYPRLNEYINPTDPEKYFVRLQKIGVGSSGYVYKGIDFQTREKIAVKKMELKSLDQLQLIENEVQVMSQCHHYNICRYFQTFATEDAVWLAMEYISGGKLTDLLECNFTESQIAAICKECLKALEYVHAKKIIHRDIKSDNFLITAKGDIKLADFGFGALLNEEKLKRNSVKGTPYWLAPEVAKGADYDTLADIWSFGIMCLEMANGEVPRIELPPIKCIFVIQTEPPPKLKNESLWSDTFRDFLSKMLVIDLAERQTASQLLEHPFLSKASSLNFLVSMLESKKEERKDQNPEDIQITVIKMNEDEMEQEKGGKKNKGLTVVPMGEMKKEVEHYEEDMWDI